MPPPNVPLKGALVAPPPNGVAPNAGVLGALEPKAGVAPPPNCVAPKAGVLGVFEPKAGVDPKGVGAPDPNGALDEPNGVPLPNGAFEGVLLPNEGVDEPNGALELGVGLKPVGDCAG